MRTKRNEIIRPRRRQIMKYIISAKRGITIDKAIAKMRKRLSHTSGKEYNELKETLCKIRLFVAQKDMHVRFFEKVEDE